MNGTFVNGIAARDRRAGRDQARRRGPLRPGDAPLPALARDPSSAPRVAASAPRAAAALDTPLRCLRGVGPGARRGARRGRASRTVGDLLWHLPLRYEDRRAIAPVAAVDARRAPGTVRGRLAELRRSAPAGAASPSSAARLDDGTGALAGRLVQPALPGAADRVDGDEYLLHGAVRRGASGLFELVNPTCEPRRRGARDRRAIVPVYPPVGGLGPAALRAARSSRRCSRLDLREPPPEPLPAELLARATRLPPLADALARAARAGERTRRRARSTSRGSPAHPRLIYGELLELPARARAAARSGEVREREAASLPHRRRGCARSRASVLPFALTAAQKRVLRGDRRRPRGARTRCCACSRATSAAARRSSRRWRWCSALESGLQGAFMAPDRAARRAALRDLARAARRRATGSRC